MNKLFSAALASLLAFAPFGATMAQAITGAGSSAAAPIYQSWAQAYQKATGVPLIYEPIGSSAGLKKVRARESSFGASDVSPADAELNKDGLLIFPVAITGIAPAAKHWPGDGIDERDQHLRRAGHHRHAPVQPFLHPGHAVGEARKRLGGGAGAGL